MSLQINILCHHIKYYFPCHFIYGNSLTFMSFYVTNSLIFMSQNLKTICHEVYIVITFPII